MANISTRTLSYTGLGIGTAILGNTFYRKYNRKEKVDPDSRGSNHDKSENEIGKGDDGPMTLRQVQVYFRHGARTPLKHIPNVEEVTYDKDSLLAGPVASYFDYTVINREGDQVPESFLEKRYQMVKFKGGCHAGQLTGLGQQQTFDLGKALHREYIQNAKLIDGYNSQDVYIRSTNINRTLHSLRCVLAGMFGAENLQKKNVEIPVSSGDKEELYPNRFCDIYNEYFKAVLKGKAKIPGLADFCRSLANHIKYEEGGENKMLNMIDWRDNLIARQAHNLYIPDSLVSWIPKIDEFATEIANVIFSGPKENRKLVVGFNVGRMLKNIQDNINQAVANNGRYHKLCLYSCHDSTLIPLLEAFDIYDGKWPPYAADVRIELYEAKPKEFWIRLLYCGEDAIPDGKQSPFMTLKDFNKMVDPIVMSQELWKLKCEEELTKNDSPIIKMIGHLGIEEDNGESEASVMSNK